MDSPKTRPGVRRLVRRHLMKLVGYTPILPAEVLVEEAPAPGQEAGAAEPVKLDGNENPYGPSPRVLKAIAQRSLYHEYPDPDQRYLRAALAEYVGLGPEHIVVGNGSDEILDLVVRLLLEPGEKAINCVPTFGMYRFVTEVCGGMEVEVGRNQDYDLDIDAIEEAMDESTKIVFVASPNNPTGNAVSQEEIVRLLETGLAVVVDEAYFEFCGQTVAPLISRYDNLMVVRTFSKWAGLAGIRIGYGIFSPEVAAYIARIKPPYNVSVFAQTAAMESLKDREFLMSRVQAIIQERERLYDGLAGLDLLRPIPSRGNFILCEVVRGDARRLHQRLTEHNIYVRYFDNPRLRSFIRITVGKPQHTDALMQALRRIGEELDGR
ncbi:MAG: histidinol-phosphate transaminase [Dehalococcoidia bacterium]